MAAVPPPPALIGNKGYDARHLRDFLADRGTRVVIPNRSNRKQPVAFDAERYKSHNVIERSFCRLKDFRGIIPATNKTARNVLAAFCLASATLRWC